MNYFNTVASRSRSGMLSRDHKYEHRITLPRHPDQIGSRDPRKVWLYECITGPFSSEKDWLGVDMTYYFASESDLMLFQLRWENQ
jgi:hypothetical protein